MINNLPIPEIAQNERELLINLVDNILNITISADYFDNKENQAKVSELEYQIDQLVYQLYGLTPEEIVIIEGAI